MLRTLLMTACLLTFCGCGLFESDGLTRVSVAELKPGVIVPQLRPGVKVRISVIASGQPVLEETVKEVSVEGDIVLPYVDAVPCAGMTIEEFRKELRTRYADFYIDPQVSADYVPMSEGGTSPYGSVVVTGCVGQPGIISIPATRDLSLYQAIQQAGGTGQWANRGAVRLTRKLADGSKQQVLIDLDEIGANGASELNVLLMPGDVVDVPESNW